MECRRGGEAARAAASNAPVIRDGEMLVSTRPGLGVDFDLDYLRAHLAEDEPWWD
jgi:L-alanine-DL-glutamate epimerase-like enolase superfamily enzyme